MTEPSALRVGSRDPTLQHVFATALLVSVAYYVGTNIGLIFRIPPSIPSVLWPPNAILTATLLLTPARTFPEAFRPCSLVPSSEWTGWPARTNTDTEMLIHRPPYTPLGERSMLATPYEADI